MLKVYNKGALNKNGRRELMLKKYAKYRFLFEELVKRDFKKKYKRTVLGMLWSLIAPLLQLAVMAIVFTQFFGRTTDYYIIYLFSGNLLFSYFSDSTQGGMRALLQNSGIFSKVDVPKYMFLLSKNIQSLINFGLSLVIYFIFVVANGISIKWSFILLIYPIICIMIFNIGVGLTLSALYVFFRDIEYLYGVFVMLLNYLSAVFYTLSIFEESTRKLFYINPVYTYITYFRKIVIYNQIPSLKYHLLCAFYAFVMLGIGALIYKKYNYKFLYYV